MGAYPTVSDEAAGRPAASFPFPSRRLWRVALERLRWGASVHGETRGIGKCLIVR